MIAQLASTLRRTVRLTSEHPKATAVTLAVMTAALFACGVVALTADRIDSWSGVRRGGGSMVVYLGSVDDARARTIASELATLSGVERVDYVAPEESARRLERALAGDGALLDGLDRGSIPASLEVTLAPGIADVLAMSPTIRALRETPGVDDVIVDDHNASHVANVLATASTAVWWVAGLLAALAAIVVITALRAQLACGRREHEVLRLLGASPSFRRLPSTLAGAVLGGVTAGLATVGVIAVVGAFGDRIVRTLVDVIGAAQLAAPSAGEIAAFVTFGALLGASGGMLAGVRVAR